jgi:uncharacterized protein (TIGR02147 family)
MLEMRPIVYNYSDPRHYLRDSFEAKRRQNPLFSVRSWAQQMGMKGHSSLVFFLNGQRAIRPHHIPQLLKGLRLSADEEKFWSALVHLQNARTEEEKTIHLDQLRLLHPAQDFSVLEIEKFRLVADWLHMAILEMTRLADFKGDPLWIQSRLAFPVDLHKIQEAINRLLNLGLLKNENGRLVKTNERLTTPKDRPSDCVREHHKQVLQNGFLAIDQQDVSERFFNSCAMTIDASKLSEAKELIRRFREDLSKLMEKNPGDETYQLSIQFFKLTEKKNEEKSPCSKTH